MAVLLLVPLELHAGPLDSVAGWEGDSRQQGYGYAGLGAAIPLSRAIAIPGGITASYLYYHYDSTGTSVSVLSPGASLMTGLRLQTRRSVTTVMAGAEMRWEHRELGIAGGSEAERTTTGSVFQLYSQESLARRWEAVQFGVFVKAADYIVTRAAFRYQATNTDWKHKTSFFLGMEGVRQGNAYSDAAQVGGFGEWSLVPARLTCGLHAGYKESWSPGRPHDRGAYFGTSLYRHF